MMMMNLLNIDDPSKLQGKVMLYFTARKIPLLGVSITKQNTEHVSYLLEVCKYSGRNEDEYNSMNRKT